MMICSRLCRKPSPFTVFEVEWAAAGSTGPPLSSATTSPVLFVSRAGSCRATNTPSSLVASPSQPWVLWSPAPVAIDLLQEAVSKTARWPQAPRPGLLFKQSPGPHTWGRDPADKTQAAQPRFSFTEATDDSSCYKDVRVTFEMYLS